MAASTGTRSRRPGNATSAPRNWPSASTRNRSAAPPGCRRRSRCRRRVAKVVGGSTITKQLAKNLFLGSERSLVRKGREFAIAMMLEALLSKQRILEIYLNSVEWGEGLFGAEIPRRGIHFHVPAQSLGTMQAARLAVMPPAPKRFEKRPNSAYVIGAPAPSPRAWARSTRPEPGRDKARFLESAHGPDADRRDRRCRRPAGGGRRHGIRPAKRKAAKLLGRTSVRPAEMPANEAVEDEVRLPAALLRRHAAGRAARAARGGGAVDERLAPLRPHLSGAVWRGTATRFSAVHLQLYIATTPSRPRSFSSTSTCPTRWAAAPPAWRKRRRADAGQHQPRPGRKRDRAPHRARPRRPARRAPSLDSRGQTSCGDLAGLRRLMAQSVAQS